MLMIFVLCVPALGRRAFGLPLTEEVKKNIASHQWSRGRFKLDNWWRKLTSGTRAASEFPRRILAKSGICRAQSIKPAILSHFSRVTNVLNFS